MALVHSDNDLTAPPYRAQPTGLYDAIITDPPYGVREMCAPSLPPRPHYAHYTYF